MFGIHFWGAWFVYGGENIRLFGVRYARVLFKTNGQMD